jgi:hypothetical protein
MDAPTNVRYRVKRTLRELIFMPAYDPNRTYRNLDCGLSALKQASRWPADKAIML